MATSNEGRTLPRPRSHVLILSTLGLSGIVLLLVAHYTFPNESVWHHFFRDLALTCFISAIVTLLYEAYFRWLVDLKKIDSVLNAVYGSYVPEKVWGNIRDTLTKRDVIRNDTQVRVRVFPAQVEGWLTLEIEQIYKLVGLHHKEKEVTILHELDADIAPPGEAPRFLHVDIGGDSYPIPEAIPSARTLAEGRIELDGAMLRLQVVVQPIQADKPLDLRLKRKEYRHLPGLYYLVQPDLADGIKVFLDECPKGVLVDLTVRPPQQRTFSLDVEERPMVWIDEIFLPGHCLEFKFHMQPPRP